MLEPPAQPFVVNVTGVGGAGKSRLLEEVRTSFPPSFVTATLDLQIPALQQHDNALAYLRSEFGKQGCSFPRFDIAYAVFWERIHPHLQMRVSSGR